MKKTKRIRWEVRPTKKNERSTQYCPSWAVVCEKKVCEFFYAKHEAVRSAARTCRQAWKKYKHLSELTIKNKNGQNSKGSSGRRTYGKDPWGTEG